MAIDDLPRSIKDGKSAIDTIRRVAEQLDGVVVEDCVKDLTDSADELERYLLADAEEARIRIDDLEDELAAKESVGG